VERPTILIVANDPEFARTICVRWQEKGNSPAFLINDSPLHSSFDLAIAGDAEVSLRALQSSGRPVIHVSEVSQNSVGVVKIPPVDGWPDLVITVATQILARQQAACDLAHLLETKSQLEREASLGRYVLEMRHSLNNALTSILGNSELMLLDEDVLDPNFRQQIETIRNMGMRMNEILRRFSSLQKEMELTGREVWKKNARGTAAGV
jgi:signal transduction histidine kinase